MVVRETDALVDDGTSNGQTDHCRLFDPLGLQVGNDSVFGSFIVSARQRAVPVKTVACGIGERKAGIGAADITDQKPWSGHARTPANTNNVGLRGY